MRSALVFVCVLWCVVVCCGVLWCVVVCCGVLWCVAVCCVLLLRVALCYVVSCRVAWCHVVLCCVMLCLVLPCRVVSCHIVSCRVRNDLLYLSSFRQWQILPSWAVLITLQLLVGGLQSPTALNDNEHSNQLKSYSSVQSSKPTVAPAQTAQRTP